VGNGGAGVRRGRGSIGSFVGFIGEGILGWDKDLAGVGEVFFAHEDLVAGARPGEVLAHSSNGIELNHRGNAGSFENAARHFGLRARAAGFGDDEFFVVGHKESIARESVTGDW
jgi:hypothetical protein